MKNLSIIPYALLFFLVIMLGTSCQKENPAEQPENSAPAAETIALPQAKDEIVSRSANNAHSLLRTYYGPMVSMGNGYARTWFTMIKYINKPLAIGIECTDAALDNLPHDPLDFAASTFVLPLHQKAKTLTPFDHVTINWEPEGHEPAGIYSVPHFDVHFYKINLASQMVIGPLPTAPPAPGLLPASYVIEGATVPQMGTHWLDPASPELPPVSAPFDHTMIYGSHEGQVIFIEPMITHAFLEEGGFVSKSFPQPVYFAPNNKYYPGKYNIWKNPFNKRHYIALSDFTWR